MRVRLGPLGTPVALIALWVAVRIAVWAPWTATPRTWPRVTTAAVVATRNASPMIMAGPAPNGRTSSTQGQRSAQPIRSAATAKSLTLAERQSATLVDASNLHNAALTLPPEEDRIANGRYPNLRSGMVDAGFVPRRTGFHALTGSAWELVNGSGGAVGVPTLGGSQMGVRLFLQGARAPVGLTARLSHALGARDAEMSVGYVLRGHGLGLLVERRERLDVAGGAFVATAYGGAYDVKLPVGLRFDGFAQAGIAGIHAKRWFGDAQARVTERGEIYPGVTFGLGGGAWASAQDDARRVEAGPLLEMRVRSRRTFIRIAGEYRVRVTGQARPRSGPAVTVGLDF